MDEREGVAFCGKACAKQKKGDRMAGARRRQAGKGGRKSISHNT